MFARRDVIKGAATLPLAAVLADPALARAAAATLDEVRLTTAGGKDVSAAVAMPAQSPAGAVLLVHEWWGLNDQIKSVAAEFANVGYIGLAVDLYDGKVATTPDNARNYMQQVDAEEATDTLQSWIAWLKQHEKANGKVATVGWCFGGGWSLNASLAVPVNATVVYYGHVARSAEQLASLQSPVLGHFATRDQWINKEMVDGFLTEAEKAGKTVEAHWYEADHAFANPTSARYDSEDAKLAWQRTLDFIGANL